MSYLVLAYLVLAYLVLAYFSVKRAFHSNFSVKV